MTHSNWKNIIYAIRGEQVDRSYAIQNQEEEEDLERICIWGRRQGAGQAAHRAVAGRNNR
jgi:hypothetical protein